MGSARRRLLSIVIVIAAAVAGAIVASLLVDEEERVREAAGDLVAPDAVVDEKIEGRPGEYLGPLFDYRGPFRVSISGTEADDPFETRVQRNESRALDEGWSERTRKEFSNGTEINYIRNGLDLRLSIRKSSPVWTVRVEADPGAGRRAMLIGALVGVVVAGGVLVAASRSQRGSEPQEPSVRSRA